MREKTSFSISLTNEYILLVSVGTDKLIYFVKRQNPEVFYKKNYFIRNFSILSIYNFQTEQ